MNGTPLYKRAFATGWLWLRRKLTKEEQPGTKEMTKIPMKVSGPDYYCPDCGRWLAKIKEDGLFDLAGQASITLVGQFDLTDLRSDMEIDATAFDAVCLLCHPEEKENN